jgi:hypothetical protein
MVFIISRAGILTEKHDATNPAVFHRYHRSSQKQKRSLQKQKTQFGAKKKN